MNNLESLVLEKMCIIYTPNGYDWMGTPITKSNPLTYHHILKKKDGGSVSVSNGALLTKSSHRKLHMLENIDKDLYDEWQWLFYAINVSEIHPSLAYQEMISEYRQMTNDLIYNKSLSLK